MHNGAVSDATTQYTNRRYSCTAFLCVMHTHASIPPDPLRVIYPPHHCPCASRPQHAPGAPLLSASENPASPAPPRHGGVLEPLWPGVILKHHPIALHMWLLDTIWADKRICTVILLVWLVVVLVGFQSIDLFHSSFMRCGPSSETRILTMVINTWHRWWLVALASFFSTIMSDFMSDSISPWIINCIQASSQQTIYTCCMLTFLLTGSQNKIYSVQQDAVLPNSAVMEHLLCYILNFFSGPAHVTDRLSAHTATC